MKTAPRSAAALGQAEATGHLVSLHPVITSRASGMHAGLLTSARARRHPAAWAPPDPAFSTGEPAMTSTRRAWRLPIAAALLGRLPGS